MEKISGVVRERDHALNYPAEQSGVTFLNMGGKYPSNAFAVVVFKDAAARFLYHLSTLEEKDICVTGIVKDYKGKPEIVVNDAKQIEKK